MYHLPPNLCFYLELKFHFFIQILVYVVLGLFLDLKTYFYYILVVDQTVCIWKKNLTPNLCGRCSAHKGKEPQRCLFSSATLNL